VVTHAWYEVDFDANLGYAPRFLAAMGTTNGQEAAALC
jgi:hypothetical protein